MDNIQQKTSFWDFKNKKIYLGAKEKKIDFISGFIVILLLLWVFSAYDFPIPQIIFLLIILFAIISFLKRKYFFYGYLSGFVIINLVYGFYRMINVIPPPSF